MSGNVSHACKASGWSRSHALGVRRADPNFAEAWALALDAATDDLEEEARRRAIRGDPSYVVVRGEILNEPASQTPVIIRRYSDRLLELLLKANRPDKFAPARREERPGGSETEIAEDIDPPRSDRGRAA